MTDRHDRWSWPYNSGRDGILRPLLPVTFTYHRTTAVYLGLVDSGADRSAIFATIAREAGIIPEDFPQA